MIETPRTDAATVRFRDPSHEMDGDWVPDDTAKELERELFIAKKELASGISLRHQSERELGKTKADLFQWRNVAIRLAACCKGDSIEMRRIALAEFARLMEEST